MLALTKAFFVLALCCAFGALMAEEPTFAYPLADSLTLPVVDWLVGVIPAKYIAAVMVYSTLFAGLAKLVSLVVMRFWPTSKAAVWVAWAIHIGDAFGTDWKKLGTAPVIPAAPLDK